MVTVTGLAVISDRSISQALTHSQYELAGSSVGRLRLPAQ